MSTLNIKILLVLVVFSVVFVNPIHVSAFWGSASNVLVEINDEKYTDADFRKWWKEWQEPEMSLPDTPDEYIDWVLLSTEADMMQLYENPSFKRQVDVFLAVRSLMLLRQDEVSDKIREPSDNQLKEIYQRDYSPFVNLSLLALHSSEEIEKVKGLLSPELSLEQIAENAGYKDSDRYLAETGEMRPLKVPLGLREIVLSLKPGEIGGPVYWNNATYFIEQLSSRDGSEDDFESNRDNLVLKFKKSEEVRLTDNLLNRLKEKFKVEFDRDYLNQLTLENSQEEDQGKVVIRVGDIELTLGHFLEAINRQFGMMNPATPNSEKFAPARDNVIDTFINQTLLDLESRDRKYEETLALKDKYDFYYKNRLIKELVNGIIRPGIKITDEAIRSEYDNHPEKYSRPADLVDVLLVETQSEKLANVLGERLKAGEDFETVMKVLVPTGINSELKKPQHLAFEIQDALGKLAPGQSVGPIQSGENFHFLKLLERVDRVFMPFEKNKQVVRDTLEKEYIDAAREDYLNRIKENSTIKINKKVWEKTRKQILETVDEQT